MRYLLKHHLYIIGFILITFFACHLNWQTPPNLDEARAYSIARHLSLIDIFSISKTEGHPFLWYYILKPITFAHQFYPIPLYAINLIFMLIALYIFYKSNAFPTYIKYFITLSLPFLKLYNSFARCYSLTIMLSFITLSIYKNRFSNPLTYLTLLILLANSSATGFFIASSLYTLFFCENIFSKKAISSKLSIIFFGILELLLLYIQFYDYNKQIPIITPKTNTLLNNLNLAYAPINTYILSLIYLATFIIFIKNKKYQPLFFLLFSSAQLTILITQIHQGGSHHYYFYYIYLICSYWLFNQLNHKYLLPLSILSLALIFNTNMHYKHKDKDFLALLKSSAVQINTLFPSAPQEIIIFEDYYSNIIAPYLNKNITLLNQTATPLNTLKGFEEFFYFIYTPIKDEDIIKQAQKNPNILFYKTCEEAILYRPTYSINLKHHLNEQYCLYDFKFY